MKKFLSFLAVLVVLLLGADYAHATACGTTTVFINSGGLVDSDGNTWTNGTYVANLVLPPQVFYTSAMSCTTAGNTFNTQYTGSINGVGAFSVGIPSNANLAPAGSQWAFTVCPNAVKGCVTYTTVVSGTTQDITSGVNAILAGPRFPSPNPVYGYGPQELINTVLPGTVFYNTTLGLYQAWNGTNYVYFNTSGAPVVGGGFSQSLNAPVNAISNTVTPLSQLNPWGSSALFETTPNLNGVLNQAQGGTGVSSTYTYLTTATTIASTSFLTTGLSLSPLPASTIRQGRCFIQFQQATAAATVTFAAQNSVAVTDEWFYAQTNVPTGNVGQPTATTVTAASTTAITPAITMPIIGVSYDLDLEFTVSNAATAPLVLSIFGESSSASDALVIEPGSSCHWL